MVSIINPTLPHSNAQCKTVISYITYKGKYAVSSHAVKWQLLPVIDFLICHMYLTIVPPQYFPEYFKTLQKRNYQQK